MARPVDPRRAMWLVAGASPEALAAAETRSMAPVLRDDHGSVWELLEITSEPQWVEVTTFNDLQQRYATGGPSRIRVRVRASHDALMDRAIASRHGLSSVEHFDLDDALGDRRVVGRLRVLSCRMVMPVLERHYETSYEVEFDCVGEVHVEQATVPPPMGARRGMKFG